MMADSTSKFSWPARGEWPWASLVSAAVMLATCFPYLLGWGLTSPGSYYSGLLTNPDEHNVYLSLMRQARDGAWLFSDLFTSEPQRGLVLNVLWLKLGILARLTHLSLPVVYHIARVGAGWLLLMALYVLAAQVLPSVSARRAGLLLAALASGFGWLFHSGPGQPHPVDFGPGLIMPEAITFLTLLLNPLFASSVFLLIVIYLAAAHAFLSGSVRAALLGGAAALLLGNLHSYDLIPVVAVLAAFLIYLLVVRRAGGRAVLLALLMGAIAAPSLLYQLWLQRSGEVSVLVKMVNQPPSPEPRYLLLGFGLPLLLALVGVVRAVRGGNDWTRLLVLWLLLGFAAVYAPISFQRKLVEGLYVPICLLAVVGLTGWVREERGARWPRAAVLAAALVIVASLPSNLFFLQRGLGDLLTNNVQYAANLMPPLYLSADQRAALAYLDAHAGRADLVLANSRLASYAPSLAGVRVYLGHWSETLNFARKLGEYHAFLRAATPDTARETFVRGRGITYVVFDHTPLAVDATFDTLYLLPAERAFDPSTTDWLEPAFQQGSVAIYRVKERMLA